jgi:two-component system response regulator YesN
MDKHIGQLDTLCREPSVFWASAASLLNSIVKLASACRISTLELFGTDHAPYDDINLKKDIPGLKAWFFDITAKVAFLCSSSVRLHRPEIRKAIEYISENYHLDIDLHNIAKHVGLSPNYFSMLFRKVTGKSFVEYLLDLRLEKASGMLKSTDLRIYEVAYQCGFVNHQYFNRVFKDKIGVTPLTFKRNHS